MENMGIHQKVYELFFPKKEQPATPEDILDSVLRHFLTRKIGTRTGVLLEVFNLNDTDIFLNGIFDKLVKDGYLIVQVFDNDVRNQYQLSFEGWAFINDNGYTQKKKDDDLKRKEIKSDLALRKRNDHLLVNYTLLASLVAIVLLAWDIYKYLHPLKSS